MITMDWLCAAHPQIQRWAMFGAMSATSQFEFSPDPSKESIRAIRAQWMGAAFPFLPWGSDEWLLKSFVFERDPKRLVDLSIQERSSGRIYQPRAGGSDIWISDGDDESQLRQLPACSRTEEIAEKIRSLGSILEGYIQHPYSEYAGESTPREPQRVTITSESFRRWIALLALSGGSMDEKRYSNERLIVNATECLPFSRFPTGWHFRGLAWGGFTVDAIYARDLQSDLKVDIVGAPSLVGHGPRFTNIRFNEGQDFGFTVITEGSEIVWVHASDSVGYPWRQIPHEFDGNVASFSYNGKYREVPIRRWLNDARTMMAVMNEHLMQEEK